MRRRAAKLPCPDDNTRAIAKEMKVQTGDVLDREVETKAGRKVAMMRKLE